MKTFLLYFSLIPALLTVFFPYSGFSQDWKKNLPPNPGFEDIKKAFYTYWEAKQVPSPIVDVKKFNDSELRQFQRWENFMKFRAKENGKINPTILLDEWEKLKLSKKAQPQDSAVANWSLIGPFNIPGQGGGMGRINTIEFHPSNPDIFWVGAASGGLWKTTDGGISWTTTTDFLPALSISDIALDPQNLNNMYLSTGDGFGYENGVDFWGGTYTAGVMKSTDGGLTWNSTGLSFNQNQGRIIQRLLISPSNPQILLAASRDGLWRTTDAGATWNKVSSIHFYDLEFNTANDSIVYAASGNHFHRSTNLGQTWSVLTGGIGSGGRQSLAVTPSNPNVIYSMSEGGNFNRSSDGGVSFTIQNNSSVTFYGYYDNVLAVSPTDENLVYVGGLELGMSADGGQTWNIVDNWYGWPDLNYCHADKHDIAFPPNNGNVVFICNDGGLFKTSDGGATYSNLSGGISISQFYRIGGSATDETILYCGQQDNGVVRNNNGAWDMVVFADGMECAVDYTNSDNVLAFTQNGQLNLSTDGGDTWNDVSPGTSGAWTTPLVFHPTDPSIIFAGFDELYKSTDGGWSWLPIGNPTNNFVMDVLAIAPSNPDYIYAGTNNDLYRSSDGGVTWQGISSPLPLSSNALTYVTVSDNNPQKIWASISGYTAGIKVYFSDNGGDTWSNISGTLPNIPVNCILYQDGSPELVYIGTDFGVYYRDSTMSDWAPFNDGLPNVIVNELEIHYSTAKIRAATYGRGTWESNLAWVSDTTSINYSKNKDVFFNVFPNPSSGKINLSFKDSGKSPIKISVYNLTGIKLREKTVNSSEQGNSIIMDLSFYPPGLYLVEVLKNEEKFLKKISLEY